MHVMQFIGAIVLLFLGGVFGWFISRRAHGPKGACQASQRVGLAQLDLAFCLIDQQLRVLEASPRFLQLLGLSFGMKNTIDDSLSEVEIPDRTGLLNHWKDAKEQEGFTTELCVGERSLLLKSSLWRDEGVFCGHILTLEDLTASRQTEEALRESESRFQVMFRAIPMLASISEINTGRFIEVNPLWEPLLGYTREETIGKTSLETGLWVYPEERHRFVAAVKAEGMVCNMRATGRRKDGVLRACELSGSMIELDGRACLLLLLRDVTDETEAAKALVLSEQKFRTMFDHSFQFAGLVAPDGTLQTVNRTALAFARVAMDEVVGKPFWDGPWWAHDPQAQQQLREFIQRAAAGENCRSEVTHLDPQSHPHYVDFSLKPVFDDDGKVAVLLAEGRDVTELRVANQALLQSNARFESIFHESMAAMLVTRMADGLVLDVNAACLRLMGWQREQILMRSCRGQELWVDARDLLHVEELLEEGDGVFSGLEVWWRTGLGEKKRCVLSGRRTHIGDEDCLIWDVLDVTAQRVMEQEIRDFNNRLEDRVEVRTAELARANRELTATLATLEQAQDELVRADKLASLGALVAGITHELNTPLGNSITVASSLQSRAQEFAALFASGQIKKSDLADFLDFSENGSDLLMRSLTQARELVTSFKQVAVDQASSQRRQFDMAELVREVLRTMHPTLRKAKTKVEVQTELEDELLLDSYPGPLGQVITNFITNALLHGFENRETGMLRIVARRLDEQQLEFVFADNGHGIPQEIIGKIFEPFFTTKLGRGGSGLGLHIAHGIVTRILGGQLQVESVPEAGTTFRLIIPVIAPEEQEVSAS